MHQQRMVAAPLPADPTPLRARPRRKPRRFRAGLRASPAPRSHSAAAGAGSQWDRSHPRPAHFWCRSGDAKDALEAFRLTPALWRCCALPGGPANVGERGLDEAGGRGRPECHRGVRVPGRRRQRDQGRSVGRSVCPTLAMHGPRSESSEPCCGSCVCGAPSGGRALSMCGPSVRPCRLYLTSAVRVGRCWRRSVV